MRRECRRSPAGPRCLPDGRLPAAPIHAGVDLPRSTAPAGRDGAGIRSMAQASVVADGLVPGGDEVSSSSATCQFPESASRPRSAPAASASTSVRAPPERRIGQRLGDQTVDDLVPPAPVAAHHLPGLRGPRSRRKNGRTASRLPITTARGGRSRSSSEGRPLGAEDRAQDRSA